MFTTGTTSTNCFPQDFGWENDGWTSSPSQQTSPREMWGKIEPYVATPVAVAAATPLAFRGLQRKSARQLREKLTSSAWQSFVKGFETAPVLGATIGFQLAAQKSCEYYALGVRDRKATSWETVLSTVMAAGATAPFLAGINGMTAGKVFLEAVRLSPREFTLILGRESTFLGAMVVTPQVKEWVKNQFGDNWFSKRGSAFAVGAVGATMGHGFDTALTRAQNRRSIGFSRIPPKTMILAVLPRGLFIRGATLGFLNVEVDLFSELMNSLDKNPTASPEGKEPPLK